MGKALILSFLPSQEWQGWILLALQIYFLHMKQASPQNMKTACLLTLSARFSAHEALGTR